MKLSQLKILVAQIEHDIANNPDPANMDPDISFWLTHDVERTVKSLMPRGVFIDVIPDMSDDIKVHRIGVGGFTRGDYSIPLNLYTKFRP